MLCGETLEERFLSLQMGTGPPTIAFSRALMGIYINHYCSFLSSYPAYFPMPKPVHW